MQHRLRRLRQLAPMGATPMILVVQELAVRMVSAISRTSPTELPAPTMATLVLSISASQEVALTHAER